MAIVTDLIFTLIMLPVSSYMLKFAIEKFTLRDFDIYFGLKVVIPVEVVTLILTMGLVRNVVLVSIVGVSVMAIGLIKYSLGHDWEKSIKIFLLWYVLRMVSGIFLSIIPALVLA